jgi:hypothetical protein
MGAKPINTVKTMNQLTITENMIKTSRAIISFRNIAHISWKSDRKYKEEIDNDEIFYDVRIYSNSSKADAIRQMMNEKEFMKLAANYTNWVNANER